MDRRPEAFSQCRPGAASVAVVLTMDFKYRWKNGAPPSRDQAAKADQLLDESQFESEHDQELAENMARKHLNVPLRPADADSSVLPHGDARELTNDPTP